MGWFRTEVVDTITGRAYVVPGSTGNVGENENNLTANGTATTQVRMVISATGDGMPASTEQQVVTAQISNWVRIVLNFAGSNYGPHQQLPDQIHLPVRIDRRTRNVVEIDLDTAAVELAPFRDVAVHFFKQTESPLAPIRFAKALPGEAVRGAKGLISTWRETFKDLKDDLANPNAAPKALDPVEAEQRRRTATQLRFRLERHPKEHAKVRASALQAAPMYIAGVQHGTYHETEFESWVDFQMLSGAISPDEAADIRRRAGRA